MQISVNIDVPPELIRELHTLNEGVTALVRALSNGNGSLKGKSSGPQPVDAYLIDFRKTEPQPQVIRFEGRLVELAEAYRVRDSLYTKGLRQKGRWVRRTDLQKACSIESGKMGNILHYLESKGKVESDGKQRYSHWRLTEEEAREEDSALDSLDDLDNVDSGLAPVKGKKLWPKSYTTKRNHRKVPESLLQQAMEAVKRMTVDPFTMQDLTNELGISSTRARSALYHMLDEGYIIRAGALPNPKSISKKGAYLYRSNL